MTFKRVTTYTNDSVSRLKVDDFFFSTGTWNLELLNYIFLPVDVDLICKIPTCNTGTDDKIIWHYDRYGHYTTKSGYQIWIW